MATEISYWSPKVVPAAGIKAMASAWQAVIALYAYVALMLYTNDVPWDSNTTVGSMTEANFGNYQRVTGLTPTAVQYDASTGNAVFNFGVQEFACTGGPANTLYGEALIGSNGGVTATGTASEVSGGVTSVLVTNGGTLYESPPSITFSGGGGAGATATATLTNGVVTGVTVTNPGSGYGSAPAVTFSAPVSIIAGGPFGNGPQVVQNPGDFVDLVPQVIVPGISA